ncbi:DUF389 domain-containing protein [Streptomyces thermolineatus]|uniref:DUF389 domain-containing protein n=1 Tax=Streptomyces thermolineatus TaxID=44033 RepID=A0ABN3LNM5_9ACTN
MLHLRLIVPSARTEEVCVLLEERAGTAHLAVLPGAARTPPGDVVMCDVAREAADELLDDLRGLGLDEHGSISVDSVDLSLSRQAERAKDEAPGEGADAVVWESLVEETNEESTLTATFLAFLTVATMLAACGVVLDSAILIVGAMVVGPEFGPVAGVCVALVRRRADLAWRSVLALLVGFPVAMLLTTLFSWLMGGLDLFTDARVHADRPNTSFIWDPDPFSFVVALLAGVAGMLSLTSSKSGALVGVAISVTTVPAAANAAVALTFGDHRQMWGSSLQLAVNLAGIVIAGTLTLLVQRFFWTRRRVHA